MHCRAEYSACLDHGTYPNGPDYTDTCPSPSTVTYIADCTVPLQYPTSTYTHSSYTFLYTSSAYTPPVSSYTDRSSAYSSVYYSTPPGYTTSSSSSVYITPTYRPVYTSSTYGYSSAYTPNPYTSISSPTPYTTSYSSPTSVYNSPVSVYTSPVYTTPYASSEYSSSVVYVPPTYTTSPLYMPPVIDTPASDYSSVPYITVELPSYTSSYVAPVYTPMPGDPSYAPDPVGPSYTPPNPYENPNPTVIIVDPPQYTNPAGNFTPVVGAPGIELRLPIDELQANYPDVWNVFCLGLESMMADEESRVLSYYQISGIHGIPHIPWQYPVESTQDPSRGYCTHSSALFATWHRPYLILFEVCVHPCFQLHR